MPVTPPEGQPTLTQTLPDPQPDHDNTHKRPLWARFAPLVVLALGAVSVFATGLHEQISLSGLIRQRETLQAFIDNHAVGALAAYMIIYAVSVAISFPGASVLTIAGGFLFGWLVGGLATILAATLGAVGVFLAARTALGASLRARASGWLDRLARGFEDGAFFYLLFLRLTPIFPFWLVNLAPALLGVPLITYLVATLIGIAPGTFAFSLIGSGLDSIIAAQEAVNPGCADAGTCEISISSLITGELLAAFFALGAVALIPVALKSWRRKNVVPPQ